VATVGDEAAAWFSGWARTVPVPGDWTDLPTLVGHHIDVLLLSPDGGGLGRAALARLVDEARELNAFVVGLGDGLPDLAWAGLVDLELGTPSDRNGQSPVHPMPPVSLRSVRPEPAGSRSPRLLLSPTVQPGHAGWSGVLRAVWEEVGRHDVVLEIAEASPPPGRLPPEVELRRSAVALADPSSFVGVLEHRSLHPDVGTFARRLVELAARAVPVRVLGVLPPAGVLGHHLHRVLGAIGPEVWCDPTRRELLGVELRRAAFRDHSMSARWGELAEVLGMPWRATPTVSVLAVTNRPEQLDHLVAQVEMQDHPDRQLVLVLHGWELPVDVERRLREGSSGDVEVVPVPPSHCLGDALNAGTLRAHGEVLVKWDDDDWYGPEHLWDLALAAHASGAQLVGKAAEFVYLEDLDVTTRRYARGGESYCTDGRGGTLNRKLAGGTLAIARADLRAVGGWQRVSRAIDQRLIADVVAAGGHVYRTHGFGYVLSRRASGHTWNADVDYFLRLAGSQWRGLRLDLAGATPFDRWRCEAAR
jgi:hypothetical protein